MKKAIDFLHEELTKKHIELVINTPFLEEFIIHSMENYAEQQSDLIHDLFNKPTIELKPLEDLWRKENPREKFTIPDRTEFYKWIRLKILPI
jgi:hypothetical protein